MFHLLYNKHKNIIIKTGGHDTMKRPHPGGYLCAVALCTLLAWSPGHAASDRDESPFFLEIQPVFSASRYPQDSMNAPSSVTIITREEIRRFGYDSLADILQSVRGVRIMDDRSYKGINIRGFGLPSDFNNRVLVLVNNSPINDNIYDSPGINTLFPVDVDLIDRVEVSRGPSSSLYGSSAFFAVINVITRKGEDLGGGEAAGRFGSMAPAGGRLSCGNRTDGGLDYMVSVSHGQGSGEKHLFFPAFDDPASNNGVATDLDRERFSSLLATMSYRNLDLLIAFTKRRKDIPTAPFSTIFNQSGTFTADESLMLDGRYTLNLGRDSEVTAHFSGNTYRYHGDYPYEGDPGMGEEPVVVNKDAARGAWLFAELFGKTKFNRHTLLGGGSWQLNQDQDQSSYYIGADGWGELDDRRHSTVWSIFLQDELRLPWNLHLTAGLRMDHHDAFGATTSPRLALVHRPRQDTSIKLLFGRAFRAPNVYERFYNDGGVTFRANPQLEPETIKSWEAVVEHVAGPVTATASLFMNDINNLIRQVEDPGDICDDGNPCLVFRNVDRVRARGMELEAAVFWKKIHLHAHYSYQEVHDRDSGAPVAAAPRHLALARVHFPLADSVHLALQEHFVSKRSTGRPDTGSGETPSVWTTNLTLTADHLWQRVDLSFSIDNLFDKDYGDPAAGEYLQETIPRPGRAWRIKAVIPFS